MTYFRANPVVGMPCRLLDHAVEKRAGVPVVSPAELTFIPSFLEIFYHAVPAWHADSPPVTLAKNIFGWAARGCREKSTAGTPEVGDPNEDSEGRREGGSDMRLRWSVASEQAG
uniref:Uncharacterized protein n=1 Tax=Trichuris muris TaxID=70415 RepID=A0A5S6QNS0_TRIMR